MPQYPPTTVPFHLTTLLAESRHVRLRLQITTTDQHPNPHISNFSFNGGHNMSTTWTQRIEEARKAGEFNTDDRYDAAGWDACAVGEAFALRNHPLNRHVSPTRIIAHNEEDHRNIIHVAPATTIVTHLGSLFSSAVRENAFDTAETINGLINTYIPQALAELAKQQEAAL